jgi:hypothetical protein
LHRSPSIHLLGAFQVLYAFVVLRPLYLSATSDVDLLSSACCYFEAAIPNVSQGSEILSVLQMMQAKALRIVQNATGDSSSNVEALGSSDIMTRNTTSMADTGNHGFESLLFGYNFSDQLFNEMNDMDIAFDLGTGTDALDLNPQAG